MKIIILFPILSLILLLIWLAIKDTIKRSYNQYLTGKSSSFVFIGLMVFGLILVSVPILITKLSIISLDYKDTGEIGDIIGGSTAPFIGFTGILVTFYAFWVQYQSNIYQRVDIKLERFENQYYEMLRLHKENVLEMEIGLSIKGRKCFVRMMYEFKYIYLVLFHYYDINKNTLDNIYSREQLSALAYVVFFNGNDSILTNSSNIYKNRDMPLLKLAFSHLREVQMRYQNSKSKFASHEIKNEDNVSWFLFEQFYFPFDGHSTRLSHYYRHLFQTVGFIVDSEIVVERKDKYRYLKLLRAQLSNHEQALLYYNGLTTFGSEWFELGYFQDYRMIKNVPFNIANFGIKPQEKIVSPNKFGEVVFEWLE